MFGSAMNNMFASLAVAGSVSHALLLTLVVLALIIIVRRLVIMGLVIRSE